MTRLENILWKFREEGPIVLEENERMLVIDTLTVVEQFSRMGWLLAGAKETPEHLNVNQLPGERC